MIQEIELHVIVGATGRLGSRVVEQVAARGHETVAASPQPHWLPGSGEHGQDRELPGPAHARRVHADLTRDGSLDHVVEGATCVLATAHGRDATTRDGSRQVDLEGARRLLRACERGGVGRLVYVSTSSASHRSPVDTFRYKARIEDEIRESSVPWTILRPTHFMEVWVDVLTRQVHKGRVTVPGRGRTPTPWLAIDDAARAVAHAADDPAALGRTLTVAGPQALTLDEVAEVVAGSMPERPQVVHVPPALLWVATTANAYHRPLFARHVRMTISLDGGSALTPTVDDLARSAEVLPAARTTWADVLRQCSTAPTSHTPAKEPLS